MIVLAVHVRFKLLLDGGFGFWVGLAVRDSYNIEIIFPIEKNIIK
jgi:hypothetical protein